MSVLKFLGIDSRSVVAAEREPTPPPEMRDAPRNPVFKECVLTLDDFYKIRAVVVDLNEGGAQVRFAARVDLPFRIRISATVMMLERSALVVWQHDGAAGLEFLPSDQP